jgi:hypothetical protein
MQCTAIVEDRWIHTVSDPMPFFLTRTEYGFMTIFVYSHEYEIFLLRIRIINLNFTHVTRSSLQSLTLYPPVRKYDSAVH